MQPKHSELGIWYWGTIAERPKENLCQSWNDNLSDDNRFNHCGFCDPHDYLWGGKQKNGNVGRRKKAYWYKSNIKTIAKASQVNPTV